MSVSSVIERVVVTGGGEGGTGFSRSSILAE